MISNSTIPVFPDSVPLALEHREIVEKALEKRQPVVSEHNFTEIFMWKDSRALTLSMLDNCLIISGKAPDMHFMHLPLGNEGVPSAIKKALGYFRDKGIKCGLYALVPEEFEKFGVDSPEFIREPLRDQFDYVYLREDLARLEGRKYDGKRNLIKKFKEANSFSFEKISSANIEECIVFQEHWCKVRNCPDDLSLNEESTGVMEVLKNFNSLSCIGGALRIDGAIQGITVASRLNENTVLVHIEKANASYKGIYQVINNVFVNEMPGEFVFINREQDVGVEGLRKAKLSYYPHHMVEKHMVSLK
ncbi:MAG: hypothetical protein CVV21_00725 [Candidatus Goldiibacteriota bacterium HGW-Goldbacteria-1]|jgi:hypothetical protein|nr:MAG: hypothetical protein CVV21_00725 [Candidatus Goldiibacteriota bacterium HGW-Goldbacteria-1]